MGSLLMGISAAAVMIILILDSHTALTGASEGIALCLQTVIPSLFPFFLMSDLLTSSLQGKKIPCLNPICKLWSIPEGSQTLLLTGLLGGYPVGARCVSHAYENKALTRTDAARMIVLCNACGPAFLFGIGSGILGSVGYCFLAWLVVTVSALISARLLPGKPETVQPFRETKQISLIVSLEKAIKSMACVCAWVILFRVGLRFMEQWFLWLLPQGIRTAVLGFIELTNGCVSLKSLPCLGLRFILFSALISFGGLCVAMQTRSAVTSRVSMKLYFPGKALQCCISTLLAWLVQLVFSDRCVNWMIPVISGFGCILLSVFLKKSRKNSSISIPVGV